MLDENGLLHGFIFDKEKINLDEKKLHRVDFIFKSILTNRWHSLRENHDFRQKKINELGMDFHFEQTHRFITF